MTQVFLTPEILKELKSLHKCHPRPTLFEIYGEKMLQLKAQGMSHREIGKQVGLNRSQTNNIFSNIRRLIGKGSITLELAYERHPSLNMERKRLIRELIVTEGEGITYTQMVDGVQHIRCNMEKIRRLMGDNLSKGARMRPLIEQGCGDDYHFQTSGDEIVCIECKQSTIAKSGDSRFCPKPRMNDNWSVCAAAHYQRERVANYTFTESIDRRTRTRVRHAVVAACRGIELEENYQLIDIIGYDIDELIDFWEETGALGGEYTKENIHCWSIDHIRPCASFIFTTCDLNDPEWVECWKMENLAPLWKKENSYGKGSKWMGYMWREGLPCSPRGVKYPKGKAEKEELKTELLRKHYELSNQSTKSGEMNNE